MKREDILEIENTITGRKVFAPYISQGYIDAGINSIQDGTWKINRHKNMKFDKKDGPDVILYFFKIEKFARIYHSLLILYGALVTFVFGKMLIVFDSSHVLGLSILLIHILFLKYTGPSIASLKRFISNNSFLDGCRFYNEHKHIVLYVYSRRNVEIFYQHLKGVYNKMILYFISMIIITCLLFVLHYLELQIFKDYNLALWGTLNIPLFLGLSSFLYVLNIKLESLMLHREPSKYEKEIIESNL